MFCNPYRFVTPVIVLLLGGDNASIVDEGEFAFSPLVDATNTESSNSNPKFGTHSLNYPSARGGSPNFLGDGLRFAHNSEMNLGVDDEPFTIEGWVNFSQLETLNNYVQWIAKKDDSFFGDTAWSFRYWAIGAPIQHKFEFVVWDTVGTTMNVQSGDLITAGTYFYFAITFDGETLRMYIDGTLVGTETKTISGFGTFRQNTRPLSIGAEYNSGVGFRLPLYNGGKIDEFRISRRIARYTGSSMTPPTAAFPRP